MANVIRAQVRTAQRCGMWMKSWRESIAKTLADANRQGEPPIRTMNRSRGNFVCEQQFRRRSRLEAKLAEILKELADLKARVAENDQRMTTVIERPATEEAGRIRTLVKTLRPTASTTIPGALPRTRKLRK